MIELKRRALILAGSWWALARAGRRSSQWSAIGWLHAGSRRSFEKIFAAFTEEIRALGRKHGSQFVIEERWADGWRMGCPALPGSWRRKSQRSSSRLQFQRSPRRRTPLQRRPLSWLRAIRWQAGGCVEPRSARWHDHRAHQCRWGEDQRKTSEVFWMPSRSCGGSGFWAMPACRQSFVLR